jgi:hypothetical protein
LAIYSTSSLSTTHLARAALNNSIELANAGKKSWAREVLNAAEKLPFSITPLDFINATPVSIESYGRLVEKTAEN